MADTTNPYLVLGVPFGADVAEAEAAAEVRRAEIESGRAPDDVRVEDLEPALAAVRRFEAGGQVVLDVYRVPADLDALTPPTDGLLTPDPEHLERRTKTTADTWELLFDAASTDALALLSETATRRCAPPPR